MIEGFSLASLLQFAQNVTAKIIVRSALNPYLYYCGVISLPCFGLAVVCRDYGLIAYVLLAIGAIPVLVTGVAGLRFAFRDPASLRSEEYLLRQQELKLMKKGEQRVLNPASLESVGNPAAARPAELPAAVPAEAHPAELAQAAPARAEGEEQ